MAPFTSDMNLLFSRDDLVQAYSQQESNFLIKRKGGGGGKSGGGGGVSSSSGSSGSKSSGSGSSSSSSSSVGTSGASKGFSPGSVSGGSRVYGSSSGRGISSPYTVTSGSFAGRQAGGGTRSNIYSNGGYGSGYTGGYTSRGGLGGPVGGLGFPFIFWPVAFGGLYGGYYGSRELNNDTDRPGGGMTQYTLAPPSNVTDGQDNMFALYGDINSVDSVYRTLVADCGVSGTLASNFTINPNQTVQYFRGSSFALLLDGYNNMQPNLSDSALANSTTVTTPLAPLPTTVDSSYLACLNNTIGPNVPLVEATSGAALGHMAGLNILLALPAIFVAILLNVL